MIAVLNEDRLKVNYNGKKVFLDDLPEGNYFLGLKKHLHLFSNTPVPKNELENIIYDKIESGWREEELLVEEGNLAFLDKYGYLDKR